MTLFSGGRKAGSGGKGGKQTQKKVFYQPSQLDIQWGR